MIYFNQLAMSGVNPYDMKNMYEYFFKSFVLFLYDKTCCETFLKLTNWLFKSYRNLNP